LEWRQPVLAVSNDNPGQRGQFYQLDAQTTGVAVSGDRYKVTRYFRFFVVNNKVEKWEAVNKHDAPVTICKVQR
jgi:hypothetical protein